MSRPTYAELGDACATAHGMELIGGRWSYPILRELMLGPKRFSELLETARGITPAVLSARLREMTASGLVDTVASSRPSGRAYVLTDWATELAPVLRNIGRWAQASPVRTNDGGLTPDAAVQAMITMAKPDPGRRAGSLQLGLRDERVPNSVEYSYQIRWNRNGVQAKRTVLGDAVDTVRSDSSNWGRVLFAGLSLSDSDAEVDGSHVEVAELLACFAASPSADER